MNLEIDLITIPKNRYRSVRPEAVDALANSIQTLGQLQPILVTPEYSLIAGYHRYLAQKQLGADQIRVEVLDVEKADQRMAEIDENLIRSELTALERGEHLAERKRLYEALHPEAKNGTNQHTRRVRDVCEPRFTKDVATKTGSSERTIQHAVSISNKLDDGVRDTIRHLPIADNQRELGRLAKLEAEEQKRVAERLSLGASSVRVARKGLIADKIDREATKWPDGPFNVLVADPPWQYEKRVNDATSRNQVAYPTMTQEEICALDVASIAQDDCILWLWTTNAHMEQAYAVAREWGFTVKTILTWVKPSIGMGDWLRGQTEHCLLAVRGKPTIRLSGESTVLHGPRRAHSEKPEEFYRMVEKICPGAKCELFSRKNRPGWKAWGGETGKLDLD